MSSPTHAALQQPNNKDYLSSGQDSPVSVLVDYNGSVLHDVPPFDEITAGGRDEAPQPRTAWQRIANAAWFPHLVLFVCQLCFAAMAITSHPALEAIPPLVYCTLRIAVALPLLLASARFREPEFRPRLRDGPWVLALGLAGIAVPQSTIFVGNHLAGAAYTGIFTPTSPVYVALISAAFRIERISLTKGIGISLSVAGALVLVRVDQLDIHKANTLGMLALLTNALSFAVYLCILQQHLTRRPFPFSAFLCASLVGGAIIAAIAAPGFRQVDWRAVPISAWAALLWAGWGTSWAAHLGICWAVGRCSAVIPSIYGCLQPLLTVGLAAVFLGQLVSARDFGAMLIILAGVALVIRAKLADDRRRHVQRGEYQPVGQDEAGKQEEVDDSAGRRIRRCPSKFFVPGMDSTAHMLARGTGGSSDNLAALAAPHSRRGPSRLGGESGISDDATEVSSGGTESRSSTAGALGRPEGMQGSGGMLNGADGGSQKPGGAHGSPVAITSTHAGSGGVRFTAPEAATPGMVGVKGDHRHDAERRKHMQTWEQPVYDLGGEGDNRWLRGEGPELSP